MVAGGGIIPIISTKGINQIKKEKFFNADKNIYFILKNMGAIPRLPKTAFKLTRGSGRKKFKVLIGVYLMDIMYMMIFVISL